MDFRRTIFLACLALSTILGEAPAVALDCAEYTVVWPPSGTTVPRNFQIVMEASCCRRPALLAISEYEPVLDGPGGPIRLIVGPTYAAHPLRAPTAQATLIPIKELKKGGTYELKFLRDASACARELLRVRVASEPPRGPITWIADDSADSVAPRWTGKPELAKLALGGFATEVTVRAPVTDDVGPVQVLVEVEQLNGGYDYFRHRVPVNDETAILRASACGPMCTFLGPRYRLRLTAIDAAGNSSPAPMYVDLDTSASAP